jgi:hypothetical protein
MLSGRPLKMQINGRMIIVMTDILMNFIIVSSQIIIVPGIPIGSN